ncbi:hypothetical protein BDEG_26704 [Batrachochytrium dendrobatidis JEL423]|uniref:Uncharacterized protein n=1 Tax=Batrachochytrium dendrobatidis (strain JEL423) TaxID=403673 RepID=A0A177WT66_BATDL|nr:hypothetical protein BDEG_26704 [Batrachochytrium dendrobatidis JEL423]
MAYNYRNITRQSIWVLHDTVHHAALVVHAFMLIPALPVITTVQISANTSLNKHQILHDTPPVQDRCMALQIKATSFFSYDTPTGLALMVDGVGAQMGDCTSMYKAEATQLKNSLQHDPSAVYPVFVTRLLTSMYETADYGDDPRLRMVIAAGTSTSHRHLMRSLSPPQSHPSPSSSHLVELWYRGGSTGAFLMEQYRLINQAGRLQSDS